MHIVARPPSGPSRVGWRGARGLALALCLGTDPWASSASSAALGANGKIAFVSGRDWNAEIYAMDADGRNQTRLTADPAYDSEPAWSPDGRRIAFERRDDRGAEIYVMGADGDAPRRLLAEGPAYQARPAWSPDGGRLLFVGSYPGGPGDLYVTNVDGSGLAALTTVPGFYDWPAWSPDGARVLFTDEDPAGGGTQAYAMDADGRDPARLTDPAAHPAGAFAPAWSPDGGRIVFVSRRDGNLEVYAMDTDGANRVRLTAHPAFDTEPDWQATRSGAPGAP